MLFLSTCTDVVLTAGVVTPSFLHEENIIKKINAINKYESQKFRGYVTDEYIKALTMVRGMQINSEYCETFEVIRMII